MAQWSGVYGTSHSSVDPLTTAERNFLYTTPGLWRIEAILLLDEERLSLTARSLVQSLPMEERLDQLYEREKEGLRREEKRLSTVRRILTQRRPLQNRLAEQVQRREAELLLRLPFFDLYLWLNPPSPGAMFTMSIDGEDPVLMRVLERPRGQEHTKVPPMVPVLPSEQEPGRGSTRRLHQSRQQERTIVPSRSQTQQSTRHERIIRPPRPQTPFHHEETTQTTPSRQASTERREEASRHTTTAIPEQNTRPTVVVGSPVPAGTGQEATGKCVVCQEVEARLANVDCGHLALCETCAEQIMQSDHPQCPLCRTTIRSERRLLRIFKA